MESEIFFRETERKKIIYRGEFKDIVHSNPGCIRKLENMATQIYDIGESIKEDDIELEVIDRRGRNQEFPCYKAIIGDQKFFIKVSGISYKESQDTLNAKEKLSKLPKVKVVDFQLGYTDKKRNYFVTKWLDLPKLEQYLKSEEGMKRAESLNNRMEEIGNILGGGYFDATNPDNAFYDEATDEIILLDLNEFDFEKMLSSWKDKGI